MSMLEGIKSAHQLATRLRRPLEELEADLPLRQAVSRRIDPLLAALPDSVALTAATIGRLGLNEHETAYLAVSFWRRFKPQLFDTYLAHQKSLAAALRLIAQEGKGQLGIDPVWLRGERPFVSAGFEGVDTNFLGLPKCKRLAQVFDFTAIVSGATERVLRLESVRRSDENVDIVAYPPTKKSGWRLTTFPDRKVALQTLPTIVLNELQRLLKDVEISSVVPYVPGTRRLNHDATGDAATRQAMSAHRVAAVQELAAAVDAAIAEQQSNLAEPVSSAVDAFLRGELPALVARTSSAQVNTAARAVHPAAATATPYLAGLRSPEELAAFLGPRLEALRADANLMGSARRRVDGLLLAMPEGAALTVGSVAALGLTEHEAALMLFEGWRRLAPRAGLSFDAPRLQKTLSAAVVYPKRVYETPQARAAAGWLLSKRDFVSAPQGGARAWGIGPITNVALSDEQHRNQLLIEGTLGELSFWAQFLPPARPGAPWRALFGDRPQCRRFSSLTTAELIDFSTAVHQLSADATAGVAAALRSQTPKADAQSREVKAVQAALSRELDERERPLAAQVKRALALFAKGEAAPALPPF
jgi:hypothetical protein